MELRLKAGCINNLYEAAIDDKLDVFNGNARLRKGQNSGWDVVMDED
jgi:hypothetical protein